MFHFSGLEMNILVLGTNGPSLMGHQYKGMLVISSLLQGRFPGKYLSVFYKESREMESLHENILLPNYSLCPRLIFLKYSRS